MNSTDQSTRLSVWLATGLGVGLVAPAPGTIGGLWGLPLALAIGSFEQFSAQFLLIALVGVVSVGICTAATAGLGGDKDPQVIVLDEIVALPIAFLGVAHKTAAIWLAGWILFRIFDIAKPWPVRYFERLPDGWGIMADDWMAAIYACLALHALLWLDAGLKLGWLAA